MLLYRSCHRSYSPSVACSNCCHVPPASLRTGAIQQSVPHSPRVILCDQLTYCSLCSSPIPRGFCATVPATLPDTGVFGCAALWKCCCSELCNGVDGTFSLLLHEFAWIYLEFITLLMGTLLDWDVTVHDFGKCPLSFVVLFSFSTCACKRAIGACVRCHC